MKLTDKFAKNTTQIGRHTDDGLTGFMLFVRNVKGRIYKQWIFRYQLGGVRSDFHLGAYPTVSLAEARKRLLKASSAVTEGRKPTAYWRVTSRPKKRLFKEYALKYVSDKSPEWRNAKHLSQWISTLKTYAFPVIENKELSKIDTEAVLRVLKPIWGKKTETATRLRGRLEKILARATTENLRDGLNPAQWTNHLDQILPNPRKLKKVRHHKAMDYADIPEFFKQLHKEQESQAYVCLEFLILSACRSNEIRGAKRNEVENNILIIPPERMKANRTHRVPLTSRMLELIDIAKTFYKKDSEYLFPNPTGNPLSDNALSKLLRCKGIEATPHGFRSTFRDFISEETNHSRDVAEMCLAHQIASETERAYRRKDLLKKRESCLKDWEAYCLTGKTQTVIKLLTRKVA